MTQKNRQLIIDKPIDYKFNGLDLTKFICTYLICIIHISPFSANAINGRGAYLNFWLQQCACRIAVPFYFIVSGFLLFRKMDRYNLDSNRVRNYCFRMLRLYATWTILLRVGIRAHLWYLRAVVIAVILLYLLLNHKFTIKSIICIASILYCFGLIGDAYHGFLEPFTNYRLSSWIITEYESVFYTTRNGLFFGFMFVVIGALFAYKKIDISMKTASIGFILSMFFLMGEVYLLKHYSQPKDYNILICLIPACFFLFAFAASLHLKNRSIYRKLRVVGVLVFFIHGLINYGVYRIFDNVFSINSTELTTLRFVIIVIIATILAFLIEYLSHKEKFKWLQFLYS